MIQFSAEACKGTASALLMPTVLSVLLPLSMTSPPCFELVYDTFYRITENGAACQPKEKGRRAVLLPVSV